MQAGLAEFFPRHYVVIHGELFMIQPSVAAVPLRGSLMRPVVRTITL